MGVATTVLRGNIGNNMHPGTENSMRSVSQVKMPSRLVRQAVCLRRMDSGAVAFRAVSLGRIMLR